MSAKPRKRPREEAEVDDAGASTHGHGAVSGARSPVQLLSEWQRAVQGGDGTASVPRGTVVEWLRRIVRQRDSDRKAAIEVVLGTVSIVLRHAFTPVHSRSLPWHAFAPLVATSAVAAASTLALHPLYPASDLIQRTSAVADTVAGAARVAAALALPDAHRLPSLEAGVVGAVAALLRVYPALATAYPLAARCSAAIDAMVTQHVNDAGVGAAGHPLVVATLVHMVDVVSRAAPLSPHHPDWPAAVAALRLAWTHPSSRLRAAAAEGVLVWATRLHVASSPTHHLSMLRAMSTPALVHSTCDAAPAARAAAVSVVAVLLAALRTNGARQSPWMPPQVAAAPSPYLDADDADHPSPLMATMRKLCSASLSTSPTVRQLAVACLAQTTSTAIKPPMLPSMQMLSKQPLLKTMRGGLRTHGDQLFSSTGVDKLAPTLELAPHDTHLPADVHRRMDAAGIGCLVHALQDEFASVRAAAIHAVAGLARPSMGEPAASVSPAILRAVVAALLELLHDDDDSIRAQALAAVASIAEQCAVPHGPALAQVALPRALTMATERRAGVRRATLRVIAALGASTLEAVPSCLETLQVVHDRWPADEGCVIGVLRAWVAASPTVVWAALQRLPPEATSTTVAASARRLVQRYAPHLLPPVATPSVPAVAPPNANAAVLRLQRRLHALLAGSTSTVTTAAQLAGIEAALCSLDVGTSHRKHSTPRLRSTVSHTALLVDIASSLFALRDALQRLATPAAGALSSPASAIVSPTTCAALAGIIASPTFQHACTRLWTAATAILMANVSLAAPLRDFAVKVRRAAALACVMQRYGKDASRLHVHVGTLLPDTPSTAMDQLYARIHADLCSARLPTDLPPTSVLQRRFAMMSATGRVCGAAASTSQPPAQRRRVRKDADSVSVRGATSVRLALRGHWHDLFSSPRQRQTLAFHVTLKGGNTDGSTCEYVSTVPRAAMTWCSPMLQRIATAVVVSTAGVAAFTPRTAHVTPVWCEGRVVCSSCVRCAVHHTREHTPCPHLSVCHMAHVAGPTTAIALTQQRA